MNIRMLYGAYGNRSGPVHGDGSPKLKTMVETGRQFSDNIDPTYANLVYSQETSQNMGSSIQMAPSASSGIFPQPPAAEGATPLSPPPYSATVGKIVDRFSGMTFEQLAVGLEAWKKVTKAAGDAASVREGDGAKVLEKQATYT